MRVFLRFWRGLRTNKGVDIYLSIGLALVVGVLGLSNVVSNDTVAAATLATLAVIAVSMLISRHQMIGLTETVQGVSESVRSQAIEGLSMDRLLPESPSGVGLIHAGARDIAIVGVTLSRTIRSNYDELERRLLAGARIRVALIDPKSGAPMEAARRCSVDDRPEIFEHRLDPALDLLRQLSEMEHAAGSVEVRLLPYVPSVGLILLDAETETGRIYVDVYAHRPVGPEPIIGLRRDRDPRWYRHFAQEFDRIWAGGRVAGAADGFAAH